MNRPVMLILALLLAAPVPAEAASACLPMFAFLCRHPVHHRAKHRSAPAAAQERPAEPADKPFDVEPAERACDAVLLAYASRKGSRDDFVRTFPVPKQRNVLICIGDAK